MAALAESELPSARRGASTAWRLASDDALVRAAARGSDGAFAALFHRYHAPLVRYCRSMLLDGDDAQDAAQSALTNALRALRAERTLPLRPKPWLYRIARNEALAVLRRRPPVSPAVFDEEALALAAPDDREAREALRELLADLRTLPERQRSALVLRELEGLDYADVASTLAMSQDAARRAVFEARAALYAHRDGRAADCLDVRRQLSEGDGRTARSRTLRAHLAGCEPCHDFAEQMRARRRALRALFPLPGILAMGSGGGWALAGLGGASVATKCAALCATAVVVGGSVAAIETHEQLHAGGGIVSATAGPTPRAAAPQRHATAPATQRAALTLPVAAKRPTHRAAPARRTTTATVAATTTSTPARAHVPHHSRTVAHVPPATPASTTSTTTTAAPAPAPAAPTTTTTAPATQQAAAPTITQARDQLTTMLTAARTAAEQQITTTVTQVRQQLDTLRQQLTSAYAPRSEVDPHTGAG